MIDYKSIAEFLVGQAQQAVDSFDHNRFMKIQRKIDRVFVAWKKQYQIGD